MPDLQDFRRRFQFGGLTMSVFVTRKDFSFLGPILTVGSLIALGLIVVAIFVGFDLGTLRRRAVILNL